jgi:hypothetical protein
LAKKTGAAGRCAPSGSFSMPRDSPDLAELRPAPGKRSTPMALPMQLPHALVVMRDIICCVAPSGFRKATLDSPSPTPFCLLARSFFV